MSGERSQPTFWTITVRSAKEAFRLYFEPAHRVTTQLSLLLQNGKLGQSHRQLERLPQGGVSKVEDHPREERPNLPQLERKQDSRPEAPKSGLEPEQREKIGMGCNDLLRELTDYLDGTADVFVRAELEQHLSWCHDCYVVFNTTKKTLEIYRENQVYELPESLPSHLRRSILRKISEKKQGLTPKDKN